MPKTASQWIVFIIVLLFGAGGVYYVMQGQNMQLAEQVATLDGDLATATEELTRLRTALELERSGASDRVSTVEGQLATVGDEKQQLETALKAAEEQLAALRGERTEADGQVTALQAELAAARERIAALEANLAKGGEAATALTAARDKAAEQAAALESRLAASTGQAADLQAKLAGAAEQVAALEKQVAALAAERAEADKRVAALESDLAAQKAAAEAAGAVVAGRQAVADCQSQLTALAAAEPVLFDSRSSGLSDAGAAMLDKVASIVAGCPGARIEIQGHTDRLGGDAYNRALSQQRAEAVAAYLTEAGVKVEELNAVGYGAARPVCAETTSDCRAKNRRIEFVAR